MNSRKVLTMLLVSLGAFSLALAGCGKKDNNSSANSETPSEQTSSDSSQSSDTSSTNTSSSSEEVTPDAVEYSIGFNYDGADQELIVWTDTAIEKTIAPLNSETDRNHAESTDDVRAVPLTDNAFDSGSADSTEKISGMFYLAVDKNGYLVYASYGTGAGYGSPSDNYYYNQEGGKNWTTAEYWATHKDFKVWQPNSQKITLSDGRVIDDYSAFDLVVPEDGFVIKGFYDQVDMVALAKQLMPDSTYVKEDTAKLPIKYVTTANGGVTLFADQTAGSLDKFYLSIDENNKLAVRERTASETREKRGERWVQTKATPALNYGYVAEDDDPIPFLYVEDLKDLNANDPVDHLKGHVEYIEGNNVIVFDRLGNAMLVVDETATKQYEVGDTIFVDGAMTDVNGNAAVKASAVTKIEKYGTVKAPKAIEVTDETVTKDWVAANNYKLFEVKKAKVTALDATAKTASVTVGETTINLVDTVMPASVAVDSTIDFTCHMLNNADSLLAKALTADILRYYNVTVDVDGEDGVQEAKSELHVTGEEVELAPEAENDDFEFSHWEKYDPTTETWEKFSDEPNHKFEIGEEDVTLRAVFDYAAWKKLPAHMGESAALDVLNTNNEKSGLTVITDQTVAVSGDWTKPYDVRWNTIFTVDKDGKIAYFVYNPANGYGGPSGSGYYTHPDYAAGDYMENPSFNFLEGYGPWVEGGTAHTKFEIHAPEGGFMVTCYTDGDITSALDFVKAITNGAITEMTDKNIGEINNRALPVSPETRVYYDAANKKLRVYIPSLAEENYAATYNESSLTSKAGISIYTDDDKNPNVSKYDFAEGRHTFTNDGSELVAAVNSEGHIIYAASGLRGGFGSPSDNYYSGSYVPEGSEEATAIVPKSSSATQAVIVGDFFALGDNYGTYSEAQSDSSLDFSNYETLVPTGGFVIVGNPANKAMSLLWGQIFGRDLQNKTNDDFNTKIATGAANNVVIQLTEINGVPQIKVVNGLATYVDPNLPTKDELLAMDDYTVAPYGTEGTDIYSNMAVAEGKLAVTATATPDIAYLLSADRTTTYKTTIESTDGGYTLSTDAINLETSSYYIVQEWTIEETAYKSIAFHRVGQEAIYNNDNLAPQVGASFRAKVRDSDSTIEWDGIRASYYVIADDLAAWSAIDLYYTATDTEVLLWTDNATWTGAVKLEGAGAGWDKRLYWEYTDNTNTTVRKDWITCIAASWTFEYLPESNTIEVV